VTEKLRDLPSVDRVLMDERVRALAERFSREAVVDLVRDAQGRARASVTAGADAPGLDDLVADVLDAASSWRPWPTPVINATGVVLHTNLGRAPLSDDAMAAATAAAGSYTDLEYGLDTGRRGSRQAAIAELVCQVTGAQAALVVNNNASAVLLGLMEFAAGKEVIVSRGEAVEIGGGFRIPDVLRHSGAELVEVGTTNRTYVRDFEAAITDRTGAILAVHASNFRTVGFTHAPSISELVELGKRRGVPVLHDLGSGALLDTADYGLAHEPMPQESLSDGVDLAFFSGDKLLGGPQAGLIAGTGEAVGRLAKHPVARAVRTDKMSLAGLATTLLHYLRNEAPAKVPVWQMIAATPDELHARAGAWAKAVGDRSEVVETRSTIGGGSLPGETLPSFALSLDAGAAGADALTAKLRGAATPIIARIEADRVLLDPRTVLPHQDEVLASSLAAALGSTRGGTRGAE
jgi:L-seryl-tRNA(Ser) seleniumtransferase